MYVVSLAKNGIHYANRSLDCGAKTFKDACKQWKRNGYVVTIISQPKGN